MILVAAAAAAAFFVGWLIRDLIATRPTTTPVFQLLPAVEEEDEWLFPIAPPEQPVERWSVRV